MTENLDKVKAKEKSMSCCIHLANSFVRDLKLLKSEGAEYEFLY